MFFCVIIFTVLYFFNSLLTIFDIINNTFHRNNEFSSVVVIKSCFELKYKYIFELLHFPYYLIFSFDKIFLFLNYSQNNCFLDLYFSFNLRQKIHENTLIIKICFHANNFDTILIKTVYNRISKIIPGKKNY